MAMTPTVVGGKVLQCYNASSSKGFSCSQAARRSCTIFPLSLGSLKVLQQRRLHSRLICSSAEPVKTDKPKQRREKKLLSVAALPLLAAVAVSNGGYNGSEFIDHYNDWHLSERSIKDLYMVISMVFCWGCCVFGSMNDPFYESDDYRNAGGNGTQYWIYDREEIDEQEAREELFRDDLAKEIEGKVGDMLELEDAEKEKELV